MLLQRDKAREREKLIDVFPRPTRCGDDEGIDLVPLYIGVSVALRAANSPGVVRSMPD